jgi:hypothetical protein
LTVPCAIFLDFLIERMWKTSGHSLQVCTLRGTIAVLIG